MPNTICTFMNHLFFRPPNAPVIDCFDGDLAVHDAQDFSAVAEVLSRSLTKRPSAKSLVKRRILLPSEEYESFFRYVVIKEEKEDVLSHDEQEQFKGLLQKILVGPEEHSQPSAPDEASSSAVETHSEVHSLLRAKSESQTEWRKSARPRDSYRRTLSSKDASALAECLSKRIMKEQVGSLIAHLESPEEAPAADNTEPITTDTPEVTAQADVAPVIQKTVLPNPPEIIRSCIAHLLKHGLHTEGIFRVVPTAAELHALAHRTSQNPLEIPQDCSPYAVASLLKKYFCEIPIPVFSPEIYECVMATATIPDLDARLNCYKYLVRILKLPMLAKLVALMNLLKRVDSESHINKMTASNLAVVIAPNLFRPTPQTLDQMAKDIKRQLTIVAEMILHGHIIFQDLEMNIDEFQKDILVGPPLSVAEIESFSTEQASSPTPKSPGGSTGLLSFARINIFSHFHSPVSIQRIKASRSPGHDTASQREGNQSSNSRPTLTSLFGKIRLRRSGEHDSSPQHQTPENNTKIN
eukprot:TRINITY_DN2903_c0_g1_i2.p1 TRINITY_DN2903_c0_g1~~TRINITY_DN2903_c0_g1_i2.p1  ORF type:complete len:556 (+),score=96.38 TRINITY_DN2903_c0_g1_i2:98-1669(+)